MIPKAEPCIYLKDEDQIELKEDMVDNDIITINKKSFPETGEKIQYIPEIISLDKVPRYSNLFISVHPFILHGYRIHHSIKDCLFSWFKLHNETLNIWTHIVPCLFFLGIFIYDLASIYIFFIKVMRFQYLEVW